MTGERWETERTLGRGCDGEVAPSAAAAVSAEPSGQVAESTGEGRRSHGWSTDAWLGQVGRQGAE